MSFKCADLLSRDTIFSRLYDLKRLHIRMLLRLAIGLAIVSERSDASATPGPDTTLVVINRLSEESFTVGTYYAEARMLATSMRCEVEVDDGELIEHTRFFSEVIEPLLDCLSRHPQGVEAVVVTRGFPLRVLVERERPDGVEPLTVSSASLISVAQSLIMGASLADPSQGARLASLEECHGFGPCWSPLIENPWREGHFSPRWFEINQGIQWAPIWVTRLDGYHLDDALRMIERSVESDRYVGAPPPQGQALFMRGANPPRSILDHELMPLAEMLEELGVSAEVVNFDPELEVEGVISLFATGSASLGRVIEGNTFTAGSLVDNLTSFGAHPNNFHPDLPEVQASIARWIRQGVSGAHGATAEPLNFSFPSRALFADYARGATLSEAVARSTPYLGWQNVTLGDPMMAAYMERPRILNDVDPLRGETVINIEVAAGQRLAEYSVWRGGAVIARGIESSFRLCLEETSEVLVIAQTAPITETLIAPPAFGVGFAPGYAKGWRRIELSPCPGTRHEDFGGPVDYSLDLSFNLDLSGEQAISGPDSSDHQVERDHELEEIAGSAESPRQSQGETQERGSESSGCALSQYPKRDLELALILAALLLTIRRVHGDTCGQRAE